MANDLKILRKMIRNPSLKMYKPSEGGKPLVLEEKNDDTSYTVTVSGVPSDCVVIKADSFEILCDHTKNSFGGTVLKGKKGEAKKVDYIIVCEENRDTPKRIFHIELKNGSSEEDEICKKLRSSKCFMEYIRAIGIEFWEEDCFLDWEEYKQHYVLIAEIRPVRPGNGRIDGEGISPKERLSVYGREYVNFHELLGER